MNKKIISFLLILAAYTGLQLNGDLNTDPWQLNVYAIGNIGTQSTPYGSDFQGMAGAGGNVFLQNFSLNINGTQSSTTPYSLYGGGQVNFSNGTVSNGGIEAAGNVTVTGSTVNGSISSGGNLSGGNGTVTGNAVLTGTNQSTLTINGSISQGHAFTPVLNQTSIANYFKGASSFWGGLAPTSTTSTSFGNMTINNVLSGRNVVNMTLSALNGLTAITAVGPSTAFIVINILDATSVSNDTFNAVTFNLSGGLTMSDILFNLPNASILQMQGGTFASLLAPNATDTFSNGVLQGNLVVQNLNGAGQVNSGSFTGFSKDQTNFAVPEPSTYVILASMLGLVFFISRKKATASAKV